MSGAHWTLLTQGVVGHIWATVARASCNSNWLELAGFGCTSTTFKYYTALKLKPKSHFYGRAATEEIFSEVI